MRTVNGLHHVTTLASDAQRNEAFWRGRLGLRRVKVTVNFDAPEVYHLYFGTGTGDPGSLMTAFPFPHAARGTRGAGEAGETAFAVPEDSLPFWQDRLGGRRETRFGEARLRIEGPDGEGIALVGTADGRAPWTGEGLPAGSAVRGLHSVTLTLRDARPMVDLLAALGYREDGREGPWTRMRIAGNGADALDLHEDRDAPPARQGAGSVHHIAFSVPDRAAQDAVRQGFVDLGLRPTPPIDRDYFQSVYVRTPGGILFELATEEPGFARDEPPEALGRVLRLPRQHAHLRPRLIRSLQPLPGLAMEDPAGGPA